MCVRERDNSLCAMRRNEELARIKREDMENRQIVDEMLQEAYRMEASNGNEADAASTHAARTQKVRIWGLGLVFVRLVQ